MAVSTNTNYSSLTDMVRRAPMSTDMVMEFRAKALDAVDHAVDTFFKPEREVAEGRQAYDGLTDVESALRAYKGRLANDIDANSAARQKSGETLKAGFSEHTDNVENEPCQVHNYYQKEIAKGTRVFGKPEVINPHGHNSQDLTSKMIALADRMGKVLPLYGSVAMVPGPLSVSLKDHLKQTLEMKMSGNSSSSRSYEQDSFRLLTLSAGKKTIREGSSSSTEGGGKISSTTVDERVLPELCSIRRELDGMNMARGTEGTQTIRQYVTESETRTRTDGFFKKTITEYSQNLGSGYLDVASQSVPVDPAYISLNFQTTNKGLKASPGSDIVDLVEKSTSLTPELVDTLRDRSRGVLNQAIDTLFKTDRELKEGREAYDQLTNLHRALKLANDRYPDKNAYCGDEMDKQLKNLAEVIPLYTCVAMVPGEMSSSVKNYAKELATFNINSSYGGSSTSDAISGSLLTLGMSQTSDNSSFGGNFKMSSKMETTTTDERIMPKLHELRVKLDQMQSANGSLRITQ